MDPIVEAFRLLTSGDLYRITSYNVCYTKLLRTVFLPADAAGKLNVGDEARIVLDAWPDRPLPATVSFVADKAQFTPREVETLV